ncbi:TetR/AcrR family transcriptional regulator [Streptomyces showdoensis]|uniref:TetR family transcriptional regulator n=1 Tax=Streptomyces showdoensis TaxID=68268 RepID=A0A2P2GVS3_STREW|nr:TetR/AcrR family transcriptional regulator [Streptomyces showdoensis]KKZ75577.1 TetR family transcriptional regulator [Streptomyces showdoensis]
MAVKRRRRTPEQARGEILDAATELIARHGPDGVGLRRVAEAVGVTHGLVTHYFGTYAALVRAVLQRESERKRERVRERLRADGSVPYADGMTRVLFEILGDERYVRLWAWTQLHDAEAARAPDSPTHLSRLVDAVEAGVRTVLPAPDGPDRERIEMVVLLALSGAYGYALGRRHWLTDLGHDPDEPGRDDAYRAALSSALAAYLQGLTP